MRLGAQPCRFGNTHCLPVHRRCRFNPRRPMCATDLSSMGSPTHRRASRRLPSSARSERMHDYLLGTIPGCRQPRCWGPDRPVDPRARVCADRCEPRVLAAALGFRRPIAACPWDFAAVCRYDQAARPAAGQNPTSGLRLGSPRCAMTEQSGLRRGVASRALRASFLDALNADDYAGLRILSAELRQCTDILPRSVCVTLGLPRGSSYARAVATIISS